MSTPSRPTSSSGHPSSPPGHPSVPLGQSSSSSSYSSSSTTNSVSAGVAEGSPQVEVFRGDDPANAVDRSDSPPSAIPLVDLSWVDPKVVEISSLYKTEASVTKFLARHPILKAVEYSRYFSVLPCGATESVCLGRSGTDPPLFYMYACFFADLH